MEVIDIARRLSREVSNLKFSEPITHVYNPLDYAWDLHEQYLRRYSRPGVKAILLGMNPGPWGMAQTGVPFGEVTHVREWLKLDGEVKQPAKIHPKRPIQGLNCHRSEVSGRRLWSWARERFSSADHFFDNFFVFNWCPLCFMEESGRNRTPDKLPAAEREPLQQACDRALVASVRALKPGMVVGVGKFARDQAARILAAEDIEIGQILHPSPASPIANRGWAPQAERQLNALGLLD
ncbi:MAG: single-stranded DNA-binding protein [Planctomycetota bacterium]|jgi:single-strand selective monofunctional uracil DNA glycosylase|nr:MAG: single-stranded DNA-binding protein [Planctomycetota bacterium]